jgi:hypothetical protein
MYRCWNSPSGHLAPGHFGHDLTWCGAGGTLSRADEVRNVKQDERQHDHRKTPLEDVLVAAHPVEHGH